MPILVECRACGKTLRAPDHAAGQSSFCPGCGANVEIPAESASENESAWETAEAAPDDMRLEELTDQRPAPETGPATESRFRECPRCARQISRSVAACPNCGERFVSRHRGAGSKTDEQTLGMLCHLLAFTGFVGIPMGNIIGPLALWMVKKDESEFVDHHGREAVNFQLSLMIVLVVGGLGLMIVTVLLGIAGGDMLAMLPMFLGALAGVAAVIGGFINVAIAAIRASNGEYYEYPYALRLIPRSRPR